MDNKFPAVGRQNSSGPSRSAPSLPTEAFRLRNSNPWLPRFAPKPNTRLRLFCFPYAGGDSVAIFRNWSPRFPASIEICPVQLPGRGSRLLEPPLADLKAIVSAVAEALQKYLDKPFAFFGHSMGSLIGFELARLFRREHKLEPIHLFVSGRSAPQVPDTDPPTYNLPEPEFIEELQRINGTPKEALEHPELMRLMLPILRNDFQVCQTYTYTEDAPLSCPITVLGGLQDEATREELEAWKAQTTGRFMLHMLPGDHFFIKKEEEKILHLLNCKLAIL